MAEKKTATSIRIPESLKEDAQNAAEAIGVSFSAYIVGAIKQRLLADQQFIQDWKKMQNMNKEEK